MSNLFKDTYTDLWEYLSSPQKDLIQQGEFLLKEIEQDKKFDFIDYSFVVFPFAKAYEGFLKKLFLDVGFINDEEYISPHFRLGKVLSPNLVRKLGDASVYKKIADIYGNIIADRVWTTWKRGRNEVFHYFPHNIRSLSFEDAREIIDALIGTMNVAYDHLCD
ncbi:MAG TPA: hypothetical protein VJB63_03600 [Patescibacteria group bacterium]|nr:hypothetical protein [Patescibacteria group bacterium]